jgi:antitoxin CptB
MLSPHRNKLKFRAWRRGFREADLILGPFADAELETMSDADVADFEALLGQECRDVYAWIIGKEETPGAFETPVMERLRLFQRNLPIASGDLSGS